MRPGPWCGFGESPRQPAHGICCLTSGDLLSANGDDKSIEHEPCATESKPQVATVHIGNQWVLGVEPPRIVTEPDNRFEMIEDPSRAGAPRHPGDSTRVPGDPDRAWSEWSTRGEPPAVIGEPAMQRPERLPQIERSLEFDGSDGHGAIFADPAGIWTPPLSLQKWTKEESKWQE